MSLGTSTGLTYEDSGSMLLNIPENQPKELSNETTDHSQVNVDQYTHDNPDFYDYAGFKASGQEQAANGHYPDTFKLPKHITFSTGSKYHGVDGEEGGSWNQLADGRWSFTPGASNFKYHSLKEMQDYFRKYEPGNVLNAVAADTKIPEASIGRDWQYLYDENNDPQNILKNLPDDMEMFHDPKAKMYWIRRRPKPDPDPRDLISSRPIQLAQNDQVMSDAYDATGFRAAAEDARTELQNRADRSFQLELRRSPVDGTFRPTRQWLEDWSAFNTALPRQSRTAGNTPGTEGGGSAPQRPVIYDAEDHTQRVLDAIRRITEDRPDTSRPTSGSEDLFDERFRRTDFNPRVSSYGPAKRYEFETKNGTPGVINFRYNPTTKDIYINWMGSSTGDLAAIKPHELGVDKVQGILKDIAEFHPDAETITAFRVSGARGRTGARMMTRRIPRELMTPSSTGSQTTPSNSWGVPGTRLTDLW